MNRRHQGIKLDSKPPVPIPTAPVQAPHLSAAATYTAPKLPVTQINAANAANTNTTTNAPAISSISMVPPTPVPLSAAISAFARPTPSPQDARIAELERINVALQNKYDHDMTALMTEMSKSNYENDRQELILTKNICDSVRTQNDEMRSMIVDMQLKSEEQQNVLAKQQQENEELQRVLVELRTQYDAAIDKLREVSRIVS